MLVFLTIFLFLQDWRGTLIPTITIPVSLIGTFALMSAFGITINLISLFGLVLAIAIVVDDAIIVVENVWRIMEQEGIGPKEASIKAMEELGGAIAGVTLTLMSVFVPASFLPGITGQIYQQFALVLASSTALSAINALTLTPALCAILLRKPRPPRFFLFRWFNAGFDRVDQGADARRSASWSATSSSPCCCSRACSVIGGWGFTSCRPASCPRRTRATPSWHPAAECRLAGAIRRGGQGDREQAARHARDRRLGHDRRHLAARQQHDPVQRRRDVPGLQELRGAQRRGLEPAGHSRRGAQARWPASWMRACLRAGPAGDPGPRRVRRLPDAAAAPGRQHRPRRPGPLDLLADRGRAQPVRHRGGQHLVPGRRAADLRRRRPQPGREPGRADRQHLLDAAVLHRLELTSTSSTCSTRAIRPTSRPTARSGCSPRTSPT